MCNDPTCYYYYASEHIQIQSIEYDAVMVIYHYTFLLKKWIMIPWDFFWKKRVRRTLKYVVYFANAEANGQKHVICRKKYYFVTFCSEKCLLRPRTYIVINLIYQSCFASWKNTRITTGVSSVKFSAETEKNQQPEVTRTAYLSENKRECF